MEATRVLLEAQVAVEELEVEELEFDSSKSGTFVEAARVLLESQVTVEELEFDSSFLLHERRNKSKDVGRMRMKITCFLKYFMKPFFTL